MSGYINNQLDKLYESETEDTSIAIKVEVRSDAGLPKAQTHWLSLTPAQFAAVGMLLSTFDD